MGSFKRVRVPSRAEHVGIDQLQDWLCEYMVTMDPVQAAGCITYLIDHIHEIIIKDDDKLDRANWFVKQMTARVMSACAAKQELFS